MYRTPRGAQSSPGGHWPHGRFPSPCYGRDEYGVRSPYAGHRYAGSPRGSPACPQGFPRSPWSSPPAYSPAYHPYSARPFSSAGRDRGRGGAAWRPRRFSQQATGSVEKYFSPAMLEDPWLPLQQQAATTDAPPTTADSPPATPDSPPADTEGP